eukprot:scaffold232_cov374-Prasinococcus_capsulatus_cf.AAC.6
MYTLPGSRCCACVRNASRSCESCAEEAERHPRQARAPLGAASNQCVQAQSDDAAQLTHCSEDGRARKARDVVDCARCRGAPDLLALDIDYVPCLREPKPQRASMQVPTGSVANATHSMLLQPVALVALAARPRSGWVEEGLAGYQATWRYCVRMLHEVQECKESGDCTGHRPMDHRTHRPGVACCGEHRVAEALFVADGGSSQRAGGGLVRAARLGRPSAAWGLRCTGTQLRRPGKLSTLVAPYRPQAAHRRRCAGDAPRAGTVAGSPVQDLEL